MDFEQFQNNHKTFLAALACFATNKQKFKRYYNDKRLTLQEKNLLKAKIALRNFKIEEGLELLDITAPNEYLKAHILYLKGCFYNNSTDYNESIPNLKEAFKIFKKIGDRRYSFFSLNTLLLTLGNLRLASQMEFYIKEMKQLGLEDDFEKSCLYRIESIYFSLIEKNNDALEKINMALAIDSPIMEDQKAIFIVTKFIILFKLHRHAECEQMFKIYKDTNGFTSSANYNFMKKMLEHLMYDTPLYAYKKHFQNAPLLEYQTNVIIHLSCGEMDLARMWWDKLHQMNPTLYADNFQYKGDYCLFEACLKKHLGQKSHDIIQLDKFNGSIGEKLVYILENASKPLTKEELIEMLWQEEWSEESSARLNTLMSRTKKKFNLDVRVRKGSYKLHKKNQAA